MQGAFGEALKEVRQVDAKDTSSSVLSVNSHLDMLRPAIKSYGGSVEVCHCHPFHISLTACRLSPSSAHMLAFENQDEEIFIMKRGDAQGYQEKPHVKSRRRKSLECPPSLVKFSTCCAGKGGR